MSNPDAHRIVPLFDHGEFVGTKTGPTQPCINCGQPRTVPVTTLVCPHCGWFPKDPLEEVAKRLPGWKPGVSVPGTVFDFLASEYGWTVEHIGKLDDCQIRHFVEAALRRKGDVLTTTAPPNRPENRGSGAGRSQKGARPMSAAPARFVPVHANPLPPAVKVNGIIYNVGPIGSPWGEGRLPADLLAGVNVANGHVSMARRLLELTAGLDPREYKKLLEDGKDGRCSEAALLAHEITCQNGAEVITALWPFITKTDAHTNPVVAGPVSEANAHAAAFAAALQLATDVLHSQVPTITAADLDRLHNLIEQEGYSAALHRSDGKRGEMLSDIHQVCEPSAGDAAASPKPAPAAPEQIKAAARAIAVQLDFDGRGQRISVNKIAKIVGSSRSTLYRDPQFRAARKALKENRLGQKPPQGYKDAYGNMDALDEEDE
jgi:hypothetical protein